MRRSRVWVGAGVGAGGLDPHSPVYEFLGGGVRCINTSFDYLLHSADVFIEIKN